MDGTVSRRRVLAAVAFAPLGGALLGGCAFGPGGPDGPDPLIALADAARADAALAAALVAAQPELAERVDPLVDARTGHAGALDAEVARLAAGTAPPAGSPAVPRVAPVPTLDALRAALQTSGSAAATVALDLPVERVGLVASVSACCATYAAVLT